MFFQFAMEWIPVGLIQYLPYLPIKKFSQLRSAAKEMTSLAATLVKSKTDAYEQGLEGGKDLMSLLIKANAQAEAKAKLSDSEVRSAIAYVSSFRYEESL